LSCFIKYLSFTFKACPNIPPAFGDAVLLCVTSLMGQIIPSSWWGPLNIWQLGNPWFNLSLSGKLLRLSGAHELLLWWRVVICGGRQDFASMS
jgi:hypothetical protein